MALQVKRVTPKRVFPPPKAAAPARGRRLQILEKAAAAEKADKKKRAAAERRRLKALEKKHASRLAARRAALKAATRAALLPLVIARDGVREFARALYRPILNLCKRAPGAVQLTARSLHAAPRRLDPRPGLKYLGRHLATLALAFVARLPRLNPLPYLAAFAGLIIAAIGAAIAGIVVRTGVALRRARNFAQEIFSSFAEWVTCLFGALSDYLRPRQLLSYSYAAAIGASLVVVGGQIALQMAEDVEGRRATEEMASYQTADNVPAETAAATAILQDESIFFVKPPLVYDLAENNALAIDPAPQPLIQTPAHGKDATGPRRTEPNVRSAMTSPAQAPAQAPATVQAKSPAGKPAPTYSTAYAYSPARPVIAVVIDDMGMVQGELKRFATLPAAVTFAFLPYSPNLEYQTRVIRDNGHEMIVHLPMEPKRRTANPGPQALLTRLSDSELRRRIAWNLGRFEGFSGINNHMGSLFTEDPRVMRAVMSALKTRGLYFLDSMTTSRSLGIPIATEFGVPRAQRDIFLDNKRDYGAILRQLRKAERVAERRGHVIAIGHPHRITYQVLKDWVPTLKRKGIRLVALSALIERPAPDLQIAENSVATELSREMPSDGGGAVALAGAGGLR